MLILYKNLQRIGRGYDFSTGGEIEHDYGKIEVMGKHRLRVRLYRNVEMWGIDFKVKVLDIQSNFPSVIFVQTEENLEGMVAYLEAFLGIRMTDYDTYMRRMKEYWEHANP